MNVEEHPVEEKAVHSWSRISTTGKRALEEALRVFSPMSKDLTDTETQLVTFLQGLREEGYQPTILSSKDVYGYSSTTAVPPVPATKCAPKTTSAQSVSSKTASKNSASRGSSTHVARSVNSSKVTNKHPSKGSSNLLLTSLKQSGPQKSVSTVSSPSSIHPGVYPAMKLSVVLEALVPLEAKLKQHHMVLSSTKQSLRAKGSSSTSDHVDGKTYQFIIKNMPSIGNHMKPLNGTVLNGPTGRILKESNACKASDMLNGHISGNPSQNYNGIIQPKHGLKVQKDILGKVQNKDGQRRDMDSGQKRKLTDGVPEGPLEKMRRCFIPLETMSELNKDKYDLLKSKVIKVDSCSSDDEVRKRAQKILQLNLSPIIRIRPLSLAVP
ncbi:coiled-coil domain-containing protein 71 [Pelodytes ibericus]